MSNAPPLNTNEVAEILGVSRWTIGRWAEGDNPYLRPLRKFPGKRGARLFDRSEVDRIKALRERQPAA